MHIVCHLDIVVSIVMTYAAIVCDETKIVCDGKRLVRERKIGETKRDW